MLRESNVVKFIKNSSVLRPGYYIGIDKRKKLVILGIRGTHTVYDLITDIVSSSHEEITLEGYSTHFGTSEAARWFLFHELGTIRNCLEKHKVNIFSFALCFHYTDSPRRRNGKQKNKSLGLVFMCMLTSLYPLSA